MTYPSPLAQPQPGPVAPIPAAPPAAPHVPTAGAHRVGRAAVMTIVAIVLVLLAIALAVYLLTFLGPTAARVGMVLALIPLAGVLAAVHLVDRWEPEPTGLVVFALAWGGVVAVAVSLAVGLLLQVVIPGTSPAREALSTVIEAPITEEIAKGLGLLLIFFFARRSFDGPVDGVVYGALVGAGFAFTENIIYFGASLVEGGAAGATATFVLRGILSPFAHVMFTAVTGYMLGRAARAGATRAQAMGPWLGGLVGAIALHALWNGSAVFSDFFALYFLLQVPLFAAFIVGIVLLRREEARLTRYRLGEYAQAGWFTAAEVEMLATTSGRRRAVAWARTLPGDRAARMKLFIREATALAAARQRAATGRDPRAVADEHTHLGRTVAARAAVLAP